VWINALKFGYKWMLKETCMKCCEENWNRMIRPVLSICEKCPNCKVSSRNKSDYVCTVKGSNYHLASMRLRESKKGKAGEFINRSTIPKDCVMILEHSLSVGEDGKEKTIAESKETHNQLSQFNVFNSDGKFYCVYYDRGIDESECLYKDQGK